MSSPAKPSSIDAIVAAAHELKIRGLAGVVREAPAGKRRNKRKTSGTVSCKVQLTREECRKLAKLKKHLAKSGVSTGKQALVRAGLLLLVELDRTDLKSAIRDVIAPERPMDKSA